MPSEGKITVTYRCGHTGEVNYGTVGSAAECEKGITERSLRRPCWNCRIAARRYRLAKVTIEGVIPPIDAYMIDNERWNGWVMPYFTKEQAEAYLVHQNQGKPVARYDEARNAYIVQFEAFEGEEQDEPDVFEVETIYVDGEPLQVYAIGSGCWVWEEDIPCTES